MPLFTWCEIQKVFHDFPGPFQAPFQANPGSSLSTKTWTLYIFCSKQTLLFSFTELADPTMKNNQWQVTLDKNQRLRLAKSRFLFYSTIVSKIFFNSTFLLFVEIKKEIFCPFQDFQVPRPKFQTFQGLEKFSPNSRIFKDRGNTV